MAGKLLEVAAPGLNAVNLGVGIGVGLGGALTCIGLVAVKLLSKRQAATTTSGGQYRQSADAAAVP